MLKSLMYFVCVLTAVVFLLLLALYFFQHKLLYPAPNVAPANTTGQNMQKLMLGQSYAYVLLPDIEPGRRYPTIIYTHGNGELADMWIKPFRPMLEAGYVIVLVEYPGYGNAGGKPGIQSITETVLKAYDAVVQLPHVNSEKVIAYGRSMGGAAAAILADNRPIVGLLLESTFTSLKKLVAEKGLPAFLLKDRYDTLAIVEKLTIPVFVFHGSQDLVIPASHGRALAEAGQNTEFMSASCGHNDCATIFEELLRFLKKHHIRACLSLRHEICSIYKRFNRETVLQA